MASAVLKQISVIYYCHSDCTKQFNNQSTNPPLSSIHYGIADICITGNYAAMIIPLLNQKPISNRLIVVLPDDSTIQVTHSG